MKAIKIISIVGIAAGASMGGYALWQNQVNGNKLPIESRNRNVSIGFFGAGIAAISIIGLILTRKA